MTHDQERRYHERQHAGYMFQRRNYGTKSDLDALLQIAAERKEKERVEALEKTTTDRA